MGQSGLQIDKFFMQMVALLYVESSLRIVLTSIRGLPPTNFNVFLATLKPKVVNTRFSLPFTHMETHLYTEEHFTLG